MLKLTYTENNFNIEYIETNLQDWIENRVTFSLRTGLNGYIEHTTASFLLPSILVDKTNSTILVEQNQNIINIDCCDRNFIEVTLKGIWLCSNVESDTGIFVTHLDTCAELYFLQLQQHQNFSYA
ncbi:MAG: hypothetical protein HC785_19475 [Calothrix sp. CSU_2_0]|nr:hypothetical protein [Calothrix sp. CSU_2_0]